MIIHKETFASGRWNQFTIVEQMANIGTDVARAIRYRNQGDHDAFIAAFYRALELIDFTVADPKHRGRGSLKEILRMREFLVDHFLYDDQYGMTDEFWQRYFYEFNYAAAMQRAKRV